MSLLDGYEDKQQNETKSLLDGYKETTNQSSLLDGYENEINSNNVLLQGGVSKNTRNYKSRFPDRNGNFFTNLGNDIKETVTGLAGMVGNTANFLVARPLMNIVKDKKFFTGEGKKDLENLKNSLPQLGEGIKENYGQGGLDMVNWGRIKEGKSPIKADISGLVQSFYAHPLNLLDLVGVGEIGKLSQVKHLSKGGKLSKFSKNVGNKVIRPRYSENLVLNAGERALETKPVQNVINTIDNSSLRSVTDVGADFLGLSPDSRLMGTKGGEVRQAKLIEQKYQTKNITERNKAIAENNTNLSELTDLETKELVKSIERGEALPSSKQHIQEIKNLLKNKVNKNAEFYKERGLLSEQAIKELPINTYASIKYNKPIDSLTATEKLEALKDIEKMPAEQQPFYIPIMFDDKLRAGDFFANTTKTYRPPELKHRSVGMGLEGNRTGGKRVYDPVELANRLDAHRIKMVNTENMINEIVENFAKPLDLSKDKVLDGYIPFNPDAFMKFYRKSIDLNNLTLRKLDELQNIDTALKSSVQEAIKTLPDDILEVMGAFKNNKIYQIPKAVTDSLMSGKSKKGIFEAMLDMSTAGFKRKVLGLSPKWFINNRIGNGIMASLKGVMPQDYLKALNITDDLLPEALRTNSMYEAEKTIIGRTGGGDNGTFGNTMRLLGGEFIDTSELKGIKKLSVNLANILGVPGKVINTITDKMFAFNQKFEDWERRAAYIHSSNTVGRKMIKTAGQNITKQDELLKHIANNEEITNAVLKDVDNTLGDYINMTATERRVIRKLVPFYSWFRTITRYTLSLPESNPIRTTLANKISMALANENEDLPEYQRAGINTGHIADRTKRPILLNYEHSIPFSTFGDTVDNPTGSLNPFITQLFEAARGKHEFMDRPFTSPNYENVFPNGYASLNPNSLGEYSNELPAIERLRALPIGYARTAIPALDWLERVGIGGVQNYIQNGEFTPKDALFDTSFGGYNYNEGFSKRPKGWSNSEQLLKVLLPLQQEGKAKRKIKTKRQPTKSLYDYLTE